MKPAAFDYVRPKSLSEAIGILAATDRDAQVMAGGQSLVAMMNLRVASPELIVDIERLDELRATSEDADAIWLGACVTHAAIEDRRVPDPSHGLMPSVAANLAYRAVRTRGTIGGSLALADPAADWVSVMAALDAQIVLRGRDGERSVGAASFTTGIYETVRGRDEIIAGVRIPKLSAGGKWGFSKFCRKSGEFANSIAAVVLDPKRDYARVVLGAVDGAPIILKHASQLVRASETDPAAWQRAIADDLGAQDFDDFKSSLHTAMTTRAMYQAMS